MPADEQQPLPDSGHGAPETSAPETVDPTTRLMMARLAGGTLRVADPAEPTASRGARLQAIGASLFPQAGSPIGRAQLAGFGVAVVGATIIGAALPHAQPVQARPAPTAQLLAATPTAATVAAPTPATATPEPSSSADASAAAEPVAEPAAAEPLATPAAATPAAAEADPADDAAAADDAPGDAADGEDPLAGSSDHLAQVALIVVHGDAPIRWRDAAAGSAARTRAAKGTTLTGFAQLPGAPLATALGLVAGQASNPSLRAGCGAGPAPLAPGTLDDLGRAAGTGCDFPAGTPSIPTAVAVDGRAWKAYAPVADAAQAAAAFCGTGTPAGPATDFARTAPLGHLADLATSGACESAAAPLTQLAADLTADTPPAWLTIEVGACGSDSCDASEQATTDRDLDQAISTLTGKTGLGDSAAVIIVGDGALDGLAPAPAGSLPAAPDDPAAPAPVIGGALLLGKGVAADATDPLALDPFALAKTQATWLGLTAPGWAAAPEAAQIAIPGAE